MFLNLTQSSVSVAHQAFALVFLDRATLEQFLELKLEVRINDIAGPNDTVPTLLQKVLNHFRAQGAGEFETLLRTAKKEFPRNTIFQRQIDRALERLGAGDDQADRRQNNREKNGKIILGAIGLVILWSVLLFGLKGVFGAAGLVAGWAGLSLGENRGVRLINLLDDHLARLFSLRYTHYGLMALMAVLFIASLFIGTVQALPGSPNGTILLQDGDRDLDRLSAGEIEWYGTHPIGGRELSARLDGYAERSFRVIPWRRRGLKQVDFQPQPFVLLVPTDEIIVNILITAPWRLTAKDGATVLFEVDSYIGEPILLGPRKNGPDCLKIIETSPFKAYDRTRKSKDPNLAPHPIELCSNAHFAASGGDVNKAACVTPKKQFPLRSGMKIVVELQSKENSELLYQDTVQVEPPDERGAATVHVIGKTPVE
jgi:hypothetical protein